MKVVPKRASRRVTRSDSAYSAKELRFGSGFTRSRTPAEIFSGCAIEVSASMNSFRPSRCSLREFPALTLQRLAPLLSCCGLLTRRAFRPHATLRLRMFFGAADRIRWEREIPREDGHAAGAIPAKRIVCRRAPIHRRGLLAQVRAECAAGTRPPPEGRRPDRSRRGLLRTRLRAASSCRALRFFLRRGQAANGCQASTAWQPNGSKRR